MSYVLHKTKTDRIADAVIYTVLALFAISTLFPLYFVFIMSVTPFTEVLKNGGFVILPTKLSWEAYIQIFSSQRIPDALKVSMVVTIVGTSLSLVVSMLLAYPLSKKELPFRNPILLMIVFTMLFSGGIIPAFMLVRGLGLYNTIWAMILPGMVSTFNMLVIKTYFEGLPNEVEEASKVDGCGDLAVLFRIVLPLSLPIVATMGLFYGVNYWNEYFKGIMYITNKDLQPIQVVLRNMIQTPSVSQELEASNVFKMQQLPPETVKMATVVVAILPVLIIYPFLQKYFMKGMLIGAIKG